MPKLKALVKPDIIKPIVDNRIGAYVIDRNLDAPYMASKIDWEDFYAR